MCGVGIAFEPYSEVSPYPKSSEKSKTMFGGILSPVVTSVTRESSLRFAASPSGLAGKTGLLEELSSP